MTKKIHKSIQTVRAEIEVEHPIIAEPKVITKNVLSQNSAEAEALLAKKKKQEASERNALLIVSGNPDIVAPTTDKPVTKTKRTTPTAHTDTVQKVIGTPKKVSMAKEIDPIILKTGPWEEILASIAEITTAHKSKMIYTKGIVKAHIKYRQNQNDIRFTNYDTNKTGVFITKQE